MIRRFLLALALAFAPLAAIAGTTTTPAYTAPLVNSAGSTVTLTPANTMVTVNAGSAQGSSGDWTATWDGTVLDATAGSSVVDCNMYDGTNFISGTRSNISQNAYVSMHLAGHRLSPAGNIRVQCQDETTATAVFGASGSGGGNVVNTLTTTRVPGS